MSANWGYFQNIKKFIMFEGELACRLFDEIRLSG